MRTLFPISSLILALFVASCGGEKSDVKVEPEPDKPKVVEPEKFEIGDGIGSHPVPVEVQIEERIKQLIAAGSDPQKPHRIEYHVAVGIPVGEVVRAQQIPEMQRTIDEVTAWAKEYEFEVVGLEWDGAAEDVSAEEWVNFSLVKSTKLEIEALWRDQGMVEGLAESQRFFEFDDWGCQVVE